MAWLRRQTLTSDTLTRTQNLIAENSDTLHKSIYGKARGTVRFYTRQGSKLKNIYRPKNIYIHTFAIFVKKFLNSKPMA